jgi:hypothetical protein
VRRLRCGEASSGVRVHALQAGILDRIETRRDAFGAPRRVEKAARLRALQDSWRDGRFHCFYTGVALVDDGQRWRNHRYLVFEHTIPGDETSVVVTCALVNRMRTDLTEEQFKCMVRELAARRRVGRRAGAGAGACWPGAGPVRRPRRRSARRAPAESWWLGRCGLRPAAVRRGGPACVNASS